MRATFVKTLTELSRENEKVMCIIGDTGFSVFEEYEKEFGSRFVNVGIAEQNFVGFGAGLAAMGMKPYIYNVVSFMTLRATEQIMLDVCYQNNPVVLVGVGGGFAYGTQGPTHHAVQDLAILTAMPNMTVVCPGDPVEMDAIMRASVYYDKPLYIRIGRNVDPIVHTKLVKFEFGKAIKMTEGEGIVIFATGVMLKTAMDVYNMFKIKGVNITVYSMPSIKPIDKDVIIQELKEKKAIFTVEEHSVIGGLGDAVGRVILDWLSLERVEQAIQFKSFGVADTFAPCTGSREYLNQLFGLSVEKIVEQIEHCINKD